MNVSVADSVTFRCPYLVHFVHCSLVVMAHSVAASNLLRTRRVQIQQRTFCNNFFLKQTSFLSFYNISAAFKNANFGIPCLTYLRNLRNSMLYLHKAYNSMEFHAVRTKILEFHDFSTYVVHGIPCFIYVRLGIPWNSMLYALKSWNSMISVVT